MGISSTSNIQDLGSYVLYSDEDYTLEKIDTWRRIPLQTNSLDRRALKVRVGDVIRYIRKVDVNANDISPVPQLVILDENDTSNSLHKEATSRLFEAVVYTDFLGVLDEENPNGILQTEVRKKFLLRTKRIDTQWYHDLFLVPLLSEGFGSFQHFEATFKYLKVESDEKFVLPDYFEDVENSLEEPYFTSLSLFRRRIFTVGGNLNLFTMENQNAKLNMTLNGGFHFGRTGLREGDEATEGIYVNNLEIPLEFQFFFLPEKRFSLYISDNISYFKTFDAEVNLRTVRDNELQENNEWLNNFTMGLNVNTSSTGRLFLRYGFTHELNNINSNFSTLQFGYSFFILENNGMKKNQNQI